MSSSLAIAGLIAGRSLGAPNNIAPDGTPFIGVAVDTVGTDDNLLVHFGPVNEINDEIYLTGSIGLAPSAYTIDPDPDGITGPQSNGVDSCCNAGFGLHFAGILFSAPVSGVTSIQVQNFVANDGGYWGSDAIVAGGVPIAATDIVSPQVQVTTNSGATWTDVATISTDYVAKLTGVVRGAGFPLTTRTPVATITFASQSGINGIRLIGDGAGAAGGAGGGFVAVTEMIVNQDQGVVFPTLDINTTTGGATLKTTAGTARTIRGYSITSETSIGAIDPSAWLSVADHYDEGNAGPNQIDTNDPWTELSASSSRTIVSEAEMSGGDGGVLNASLNVPLGNIWNQNPFGDDLRGEVLLADGSVRRMNITYNGLASNPIPMGDMNFDGSITTADWPTVRNNFNTSFPGLTRAQAYGFGDLTGDGKNDAADFSAFKTLYDAANGSGAFAQMLAGEAPEPGSLALLVLGAGLLRLRLRNS